MHHQRVQALDVMSCILSAFGHLSIVVFNAWHRRQLGDWISSCVPHPLKIPRFSVRLCTYVVHVPIMHPLNSNERNDHFQNSMSEDCIICALAARFHFWRMCYNIYFSLALITYVLVL
jgi:hypothetical protein